MAKSKLSWSLVETKLVVEILATQAKVTFDIGEIYPNFMDMSDVQQRVIANGLKQKLADHLARTKDMVLTPIEMKTELEVLWERLCNGHWNVEGKGGRVAKIDTAWGAASDTEKAILTKLGLKPKNVE